MSFMLSHLFYRYAERHLPERRYAECRGAQKNSLFFLARIARMSHSKEISVFTLFQDSRTKVIKLFGLTKGFAI
jgi:hypothetical protein